MAKWQNGSVCDPLCVAALMEEERELNSLSSRTPPDSPPQNQGKVTPLVVFAASIYCLLSDSISKF
ncbi:hypothetical protein RND71_042389 [Anisodus tanguticus]|uniref:Uncharacterized protein n=1 Tax=Anisodus tanguticus TaxID=243964 RepID=A0AAE1QTB7_9SOLA|nr:hypothetical protein RND71_042389 [Anisodus tanguticus]